MNAVAVALAPDDVRTILRRLVGQRQDLRRASADRASLEANRLAIVYWQGELARALIAARAGADR